MAGTGRRDFLFASGAAALMAGGPAWASAARAAAGTAPAPRFPSELEQAFADGLAKARVTGAAITVVQNGAVRGFFPYGRASIPFDVPVTSDTLFHVGSVGKHVTALAVLQLVEAGKLGLEWPIGRVVEGLPEWIAAISISDLLAHTGGVPDYEDGFAWDRPFPRTELLATLKAPDFAPGEAWSYSNSGYVLLGYAIEAASGLSYRDYVVERLFKPAGTLRARPDAADQPIVGRAEPYELQDDIVRHAVRMEGGVSAMPDGGVLFSSSDWGPWQRAIEDHRLVGPALTAQMFSPHLLNSGATSGYGFGWLIDQVSGQPFFSHSGGVPGFVTLANYYPRHSLMAVATFNSPPMRSIRSLVDQAIEAFAPNTTPMHLRARPQSARREQRLREFLAGGIADTLVAPQLLLGEKAGGQDPAKRVSAQPTAIEFLESYAAPGGEIARYRLTINGAATGRQIGWTPDDRVFLFR